MHGDSEPAGERNRGPLEPNPILEIEAPGSQAAFHAAPSQQNDSRFIKQASFVGIASPWDIPVKTARELLKKDLQAHLCSKFRVTLSTRRLTENSPSRYRNSNAAFCGTGVVLDLMN